MLFLGMKISMKLYDVTDTQASWILFNQPPILDSEEILQTTQS